MKIVFRKLRKKDQLVDLLNLTSLLELRTELDDRMDETKRIIGKIRRDLKGN